MKTALILILFLTPVQQEREILEQIEELQHALDDTKDGKKRERIQASIAKLKVRLKHLRDGKMEEEGGNLDQRLKVNPDDIEARLERARMRMERKEFEGALKDALLAIKSEEEESWAWIVLGEVYHWMKKPEESDKAFARAIDLERDVQDHIHEFLREHAPERLRKMDSMVKAMRNSKIDIKTVEAKLLKNPDDVGALVLRAQYNLDRNLDNAFADLTRALKLDKKFAAAYRIRAVAWAKKGRMERAERDLFRSERLAPEARREFRMAERAIHKEEAAREYARRSRADIDEQIRTLRERLAELRKLGEDTKPVDTEIARLEEMKKKAPESELREEDWEKLEQMERGMHKLAKAYRDDRTAANKKAMREAIVRFIDYRYRIQKRELENIKREIREYENEREMIIEDHIQGLSEHEEDDE